jgi:DNA-binding NarL/FixJ family response regulator
MTVKILLADDHSIIRDGLRMILEAHADMTVVETASSGRDAISKAKEFLPDIIIMDIAMPELNGIDATRAICKMDPHTRVIFLSMHHTPEHVHRALQAGGRGYLLKESAGSEVVKAVRAVMNGAMFFGKGVEKPKGAAGANCPPAAKSPLETLSDREREVLQLVVEGKTSATIAEMLSLSPKSVETYRSRLMKKLSIDDIPTLVKFAIQHGITPPL